MEDIDVTQALKDAENALRDFIASVLQRKFGAEWEANTGVSEDRLKAWRERKAVEKKRQSAGVVEERLLYYADFYDLPTIIRKNWDGDFSAAFDDIKTLELLMKQLEKLRDPDAHRRELLPHQKHLVLGISGTIRSMIMRFRSTQETGEGHFPRFESIRDSIGNIWVAGEGPSVVTGCVLHPGDQLDFVLSASDPQGSPLQYSVWKFPEAQAPWSPQNTWTIKIDDSFIGTNMTIMFAIWSGRSYKARVSWDDCAGFEYIVLPNR